MARFGAAAPSCVPLITSASRRVEGADAPALRGRRRRMQSQVTAIDDWTRHIEAGLGVVAQIMEAARALSMTHSLGAQAA